MTVTNGGISLFSHVRKKEKKEKEKESMYSQSNKNSIRKHHSEIGQRNHG